MAKCDICGEKIQSTFLNKIIGTIIKINGKQKYVCRDCQKEHKDLKEKLTS